jgi:glycosyltransferase involved in cell wall biosynthesis
MINQNKLISIGMPVFNSEKFIRQALDSLLAQKYKNFEINISDNSSTDKTEEICKEYVAKDRRIYYYRNNQNIGVQNFKRVLNLAKGDYFMWAADDDIWHPDFISSCIKILENNKDLGMAFSNIVNINSFGRIIRRYPSFKKFSGENNKKIISNYVKDPEIMGKANLIYGIYRLKLCKESWESSPLNESWGSDMCFVLATISRSSIGIDERILFQKRIAKKSDKKNDTSEKIITNPKRHIFPLNKSFEYIKNNLKAVKNTKYHFIVLSIMTSRLPRVLWNFFLNKINELIYLIKKIINKFKRSLKSLFS